MLYYTRVVGRQRAQTQTQTQTHAHAHAHAQGLGQFGGSGVRVGTMVLGNLVITSDSSQFSVVNSKPPCEAAMRFINFNNCVLRSRFATFVKLITNGGREFIYLQS